MATRAESAVSCAERIEDNSDATDSTEQQQSLLSPHDIQQHVSINENGVSRDGEILSELCVKEDESPTESVTGSDHRKVYREKLRYTVFIFFTNFSVGCLYTLYHAAFLDLMRQTNSEIDQGALLFVLNNVGYTLGSLLFGPLYDRFNADVILGSCAFLGGVLNILIPFSPLFWVVSTVVFFSNFFLGSVDSGSIFLCSRLWRDGANPYQQGVALFFALGGVLSPLVAEPFLLPKEESGRSVALGNLSSPLLSPGTINASSVLWPGNNSIDDSAKDLDTRELMLYVPFTIFGTLMVFSAIPFMVIFALAKAKCGTSENLGSDSEIGQTYKKNSCKYLFAALTLVVLYFMSYGLLLSLAEFCMPFTVDFLGWPTASGAWLSSAASGAVVLGCFIGIFVANILRPSLMTAATMVPITGGLIALLVGARHSNVVVWVSYIFIFAGIGSLFPSAISWIDQRLVRANGRICSLFTVAFCVGDTANVWILGHLFQMNSPMWLIYVSLGASVVQWATLFVLFRTNVWLSKRITEKSKDDVDVFVLK